MKPSRIISCLAIFCLFHQIQASIFWNFISKDESIPSPTADEAEDDDLDNDSIHTIKEVDPIEAFPSSSGQDQNQDQQEHISDSNLDQQTRAQDSRYAQPQDPRMEQHPNYPDETCSEGQYMCRKISPSQTRIRCIPNEWKCNGVRDCEENDDEARCDEASGLSGYKQQHYQQSIGQDQKQYCKPDQHLCYGTGSHGVLAKCLDRQQICDKINDCPYGDDERTCPQNDPNQQQQQGQNSGMYNPRMPHHQQQQNQYLYGRQQSGQYDHSQQQQQQQSSDREQVHHSGNSGYEHYPQNIDQRIGSSGSDRQQISGQDACKSGRSEEYIKRLEFLDRCYRSCMRYQF